MSTYESAVSMVQELSESDLVKVREYIKKLMMGTEERTETYNPFVKLSREEIIQQLAFARKHAEEGKVKDARQISADIRAKYAR